MKTVVTRVMTVMNSKGEAETFEKTPAGEFRDDIDIDTYGRLNRAGAAVLYVDDNGEVETLADPETKAEAIVDEVGGPIESPVTGQDVAPTEGVTHQEQLEGADQTNGEPTEEVDAATGTDDPGEADTASDEELDAMTKAELIEYAGAHNVDVDERGLKADILAAIKAS